MVGPPPTATANSKPSSFSSFRPFASPLLQAKKSNSLRITGTQITVKLEEINGRKCGVTCKGGLPDLGSSVESVRF